jgi:Spy/CpxP family protein refolding chaperone
MKPPIKTETITLIAVTALLCFTGCKPKAQVTPRPPMVEVEVLEAQQQLFPSELNLARTQRDQLLAVVSLYKALGGGWQDEMKPNRHH